MGTSTPDIKRGLAGVIADTTAVSMVNPESNSLLYRGYPVQELAASCSFEEVAYLLWYGDLPNSSELASFEKAERSRPRCPAVAGHRSRRTPDELPPDGRASHCCKHPWRQ